jgi:GcrA cell cycle regulator
MLLTTIINPADTPTRWDEATVDTLKTLWAEGWTGAAIARKLGNGHTRCSVLGKVQRLGVASRISKPRNHSAPRPRVVKSRPIALVKARPRPLVPVAPYVPLPQIETSRPGVSFMALNAHTCRWPLGEPKGSESMFCGAEPVAHSSYCSVHRARGLNGTIPEQSAVRDARKATAHG